MAFTAMLGTVNSELANIELGAGAQPFVPGPTGGATLYTGIVQNRFQTAKVVQRSTNQLDTVPKAFDMAVTEIYPYSVDVANYLGTNDSVVAVAPYIYVYPSLRQVRAPWYEGVIVQGTVITIPVLCSYLAFGNTYQVKVNFTANSNKKATFTSLFNLVS